MRQITLTELILNQKMMVWMLTISPGIPGCPRTPGSPGGP